MKKDSKIKIIFVLMFMLIILISAFSLSKYQYYLPGDSTYHWKQVNEIIEEKKVITYNAIFPESPLFYPTGYHVLMSSYSLVSGIDSIKVFLFVPLVLYLFYFSVVYFFVKRLTKNSIIGLISAFSILFFWSGYPGYRIFAYLWPVPAMITPFLILIVITLLLSYTKQHYIIISLLIFSIGLMHRSNSIILLIILGIFFLFNLIKREKRLISIILILILLISWSSWFVPYYLRAGIPVEDFKSKILPPSQSSGVEDAEISLATSFKDTFSSFIAPFYLKNFSLILMVWLLFSILGLILFIKEFWKSKIALLMGIFLVLIVINSFLNIGVINEIMPALLVPFSYCLFFGVGVYYTLSKSGSEIGRVSFLVLFLIVIITSLQVASNLYFERLDIPKYYQISSEAIEYLKNTTPNATIFADGWTSYVLSMLTEKEVYITQPGHIGPLDKLNHTLRMKNVEAIMESCDINESVSVLNENKPFYLYLGSLEEAHYRICHDKFDKHFERIDFDDERIYYDLK